MEIKYLNKDDGIYAELFGELDEYSAEYVRISLDDLLNKFQNKTKLVLDFASLEYLSSAGLRVLLQAQKTMNKQGEMVVRNVNETISEIFEVTGFSDVLTIE